MNRCFLLPGFGILAGLMILGGCAVGPDYKRPAVQAPENFRFTDNQTTNSLGDLPWWQVFKDPVLQGLIATAVTNNYNLQAGRRPQWNRPATRPLWLTPPSFLRWVTVATSGVVVMQFTIRPLL